MAKQFLYGLRMRPAGLGAVPPGFRLHDVDRSNANMRHGAVSYETALTDEEVKQYELVPLTDETGARLQCPLLPHAVFVKVKEAVDFFAYLDEQPEIDAADIHEEMAVMAKKLDIFIDWAAARQVNWADAIGELGGLPKKFFEQRDGRLIYKGCEDQSNDALRHAARSTMRH